MGFISIRVLIAALAGALLAVSGTSADASQTSVKLDGAPFRPELALTATARARGLMYRKRAPADGMLFVFDRATRGSFWMKNTLVPLRITFFDTAGRRVQQLSMTPCRRDPCRSYSPAKDYRFALELRASDRRAADRLGPASELRRLIRLAE